MASDGGVRARPVNEVEEPQPPTRVEPRAEKADAAAARTPDVLHPTSLAVPTITTNPALASGVKPRPFATFTERYFDQYVAKDVRGAAGHNLRLLVHSNGLIVVCLDPSHTVLRDGRPPAVSFEVKRHKKDRESHDRRQDTDSLRGKRKKDALWLQPDTALVAVGPPPPPLGEPGDGAAAVDEHDEDAQRVSRRKALFTATYPFKVPAMVTGALLEINPRIAEDPSLLTRAPLTDGYIAIMNPRGPAVLKAVLESMELVSKSLATLNPIREEEEG